MAALRKIIEGDGYHIEVECSESGWPRWTRLSIDGTQVLLMREETARELSHAFARVEAHLDRHEHNDKMMYPNQTR
jgi:hypothetical protein